MTEVLYRRENGAPAPLPTSAFDPAGFNWTDLTNSPEGRAACGFVLAPAQPAYNSVTQRVRWDEASQAWVVEAQPPAPPSPEPRPLLLGKVEFIELVQMAGGMTDEMLVTAHADPKLGAFWIKFQMASQVERDFPTTGQALGALAALGYLPDGVAPVLSMWPTA